MKSKKILIRKDQHQISQKLSDLRYNLKEAQKYTDWFHSVSFNEPLKGLETVKQFLTNPHHVYEMQIKKHLTELTGLKTLPPDIEPLKTMYQIPPPQAWSVSEKFGFQYLQIDESGKLSYAQEIFDIIEKENAIYATPEQAQALQELDRTFNNCIQLCELFSPSKTHENLYKSQFEKAFGIIEKDRKDNANLTQWNLEGLEKLANAGFGQNNNK